MPNGIERDAAMVRLMVGGRPEAVGWLDLLQQILQLQYAVTRTVTRLVITCPLIKVVTDLESHRAFL